MLGLSWAELATILVIAIIIIKPKDIPGLVKKIAELIAYFKKLISDFEDQVKSFKNQLEDQELKQKIADFNNFELNSEIDAAAESVKKPASSLKLIKGDDGKYYQAYDPKQLWQDAEQKANQPDQID